MCLRRLSSSGRWMLGISWDHKRIHLARLQAMCFRPKHSNLDKSASYSGSYGQVWGTTAINWKGFGAVSAAASLKSEMESVSSLREDHVSMFDKCVWSWRQAHLIKFILYILYLYIYTLEKLQNNPSKKLWKLCYCFLTPPCSCMWPRNQSWQTCWCMSQSL